MRRGNLLLAIVVAVGLAAPAGAQTVKAGTALFAYDSGEPLDLVVTDSSVQAGVLILDITYASPVRGRVPAYLFVPEAEGPHAGLLLLHGLPGSRNDLRSLAAEYARLGAVVLTISAPFARPDGPRSNPVTFTEQDRDEQIQLIKDLRRGVDLLVARDDVDPGRLGFVGGSYGGAMGGLLAGVEDRIKAYALFVGDGGLVAHFTGPGDLPPASAEQFDRWKALMEPIEPLRFVGQAAPAELLFQQGRVDRMVPPADAEAYAAAGSEPKTVLWYDHGHEFSQAMRRDQIAWLTERLGLHHKRVSQRRDAAVRLVAPGASDEAFAALEADLTWAENLVREELGPLPDTVVVRVLPDRESFTRALREAWGIPETQCWMVGAADDHAFYLLAPGVWASDACEHDAADEESRRRLIAHELVHVHHGQVNGSDDIGLLEDLGWFIEGVATYLSGQLCTSHRGRAEEAIRQGRAPDALSDAWSGPYRYGVTGSMAAYIDRHWDRPALRDALGARSQVEVLRQLGLSESAFIAGWREWVLNGGNETACGTPRLGWKPGAFENDAPPGFVPMNV